MTRLLFLLELNIDRIKLTVKKKRRIYTSKIYKNA